MATLVVGEVNGLLTHSIASTNAVHAWPRWYLRWLGWFFYFRMLLGGLFGLVLLRSTFGTPSLFQLLFLQECYTIFKASRLRLILITYGFRVGRWRHRGRR